jgi:hypothetical protein
MYVTFFDKLCKTTVRPSLGRQAIDYLELSAEQLFCICAQSGHNLWPRFFRRGRRRLETQ